MWGRFSSPVSLPSLTDFPRLPPTLGGSGDYSQRQLDQPVSQTDQSEEGDYREKARHPGGQRSFDYTI